MKKKLLLLHLLAPTFFANAQNVGIGTPTPLQKLHVEGTTYLNGNVGIGNVNPSLAGLVVDTKVGADNAIFGSNTTGVAIESSWPGIGFNTFYNNSRKAIATGYGGLIYVNPVNGGMSLSVTNASYSAGAGVAMNDAINIKPDGNIGIGTNAPGEKLSIVSSDNNSVTNIGTFYPNNLTQGIGIGYDEIRKIGTNANGNLYINAKGSGNLILENSATGYVGIGTASPAFKLDVADRMRIRSGGGFSTAGLYLNSNDNSSSPAFIGMDDDTHVGFWGSGVGWRFSMNTNTGALKINGSEGTAGQVLQSNGASSPSWINPLNAFYNNMTEYSQSAVVNMNNPGPGSAYSIPGLTGITLVITSVSKVIFSGSIFVVRNACGGCPSVAQYFQVSIASPFTPVAENQIYISPLESVTLPTGMRFQTLNPGTYTINATIFNGAGGSGTASQGWLNIIVIPQ